MKSLIVKRILSIKLNKFINRKLSKNIFSLILALSFLTFSEPVFADTNASESLAKGKEPLVEIVLTPAVETVSNASELAPKANELSDNYNKLSDKILEFGKFLTKAREKLESNKETFKTLKDSYTQTLESKYTQFNNISEIRIAIWDFSLQVDKDISEYTLKITELNNIKKEWETRKENWQKWRSDFYKEYNVIRDVFLTANTNITNALNDIKKIEKPLLLNQTELASFQTDIKNVLREIDTLLGSYKKDVFRKTNLSFFTKNFWTHFDAELYKTTKELIATSYTQSIVGINQKHIIQMAINLLLAVLIGLGLIKLKNKDIPRDNIKKLAKRPFSTSLFISTIIVGVYFGTDLPSFIKIILLVIVSVCGARAVFCFIERASSRVFLNILVIAFLLSRLFVLVNMPEPIVRVYIASVTLLILLLCMKYKKTETFCGKGIVLNTVMLLTFSSFVAELAGFSQLSLKIFDSSVRCLFSGILIWLAGVLIKEGTFVILNYSWLSRFKVCKNYIYYILKKITILINVLVSFFILCAALVAWGVYGSMNRAVVSVRSLGFSVQGNAITVGDVFLSIFLFYFISFISWVIQRVLDEEVYPRKKVQYGVQSSINRIIQYTFICIGALVALSVLGINLKNLAVVFGVLGVGIGFGLQNIVNNFASGLILLFERPIKEGDVVEIGGQQGTVRKIGLRATIIELFDKTEVIVPNSEIASTKVTNLTLSNRNIRSAIDVGVAYGSDMNKVIEVLLDIVKDKEGIYKDPKPIVAFSGFGGSSFNFTLRFWSLFDDAFNLKNKISKEIYERFSKEGIEVPFNMMNVNLVGLKEEIANFLEHKVNKDKNNK